MSLLLWELASLVIMLYSTGLYTAMYLHKDLTGMMIRKPLSPLQPNYQRHID